MSSSDYGTETGPVPLNPESLGGLTGGTAQWLNAHYRTLREIPGPEAEPFLRRDLPAEVREVFDAMISNGAVVDCGHEYDNGGTRRYFWALHPEARRWLDEFTARHTAGVTAGGPAPNPLPCDCPAAAFKTLGRTIWCKDCGQHTHRETRELVDPGTVYSESELAALPTEVLR